MAFAGASLASCGSTNITETSFTVNEVTLKDGVEAFEKTENQLENGIIMTFYVTEIEMKSILSKI